MNRMMFCDQVRFQTLLWRTHSLIFWASCCPLFLWPVYGSTRGIAKFLCAAARNQFCHSKQEWEMPASPVRAGKSCWLFLTSPFGVAAAYGHGHPYLGLFCCSPAICTSPLDYCVFCLCVKPAMVLPQWDAAETKCNWRCLERGLLGETRAVLVNPACRWHVHILTSLAAGGSCINFLSALTD